MLTYWDSWELFFIYYISEIPTTYKTRSQNIYLNALPFAFFLSLIVIVGPADWPVPESVFRIDGFWEGLASEFKIDSSFPLTKSISSIISASAVNSILATFVNSVVLSRSRYHRLCTSTVWPRWSHRKRKSFSLKFPNYNVEHNNYKLLYKSD